MILPGTRPPAAERARTVLAHAATLTVVVDGVVDGGDGGARGVLEVTDLVGVDSDGSLVLLVEVDGPLAGRVVGHAVPCRVHAALVSPVPGPDRLLDRVAAVGHAWLAGDVGAALEVLAGGRAAEVERRSAATVLLRMKIAKLQLNGGSVNLAAYGHARPDPLAAFSDEYVEHLVSGHAAEVLQLAHLFDPDVVSQVRAFAPVRVDRFGLTFRIDTATGSTTTRVDFPEALNGRDELAKAMNALQMRAAQVTICPFNGRPRAGAGRPPSAGCA